MPAYGKLSHMGSILTPFEFSDTAVLSRRLFRKKLLPIADIDYDGRKIEFTPAYLQSMVDAFNDGAYDNVPLQFAGPRNEHTNEPERHRGDVVAMSLEQDGLYVTVSATPEGAKVLQDNPKLGVSARIINGYDRSDGRHYDASVQHVLATHDPRIPGLGPWSAVDSFSNENDSDTIDLTAGSFNTKEKHVPDNGLSETELTRLRAFMAELDAADKTDETDDELSDEELAALLAEIEGDETPETVKETVAALSNDPKAAQALELANAQAIELAAIREERDNEKWQRERERLVRDLKFSPAVAELAMPLLKGSRVVELSNGEKLDAGDATRKLLNEIAKTVKMLDLSSEQGSGLEGPDGKDDEAAKRRDETTKAFRAMMGS